MSDFDPSKLEYHADLNEAERIFEMAEGAANSDWEINFVSDLKGKFDKYGLKMFISLKQWTRLEEIAER